jgi:hypothetical protein
MKQRCEETTHKQYSNYGGRGIKILWESYEYFYRDMAPTYQSGLTIDRRDNDGPYSKENCRWATYKEQNLNRRSNRLVSFCGKTQPLSCWAWMVGLAPITLAYRLNHGWPIFKALTLPVDERKWNT